jgi:phosphoribosyl-ATP pyrophosphohydrolase/phosphoribosyl-AMP cyclohydrolase
MNTPDFSKGLIPAIIQDQRDGSVLMLAYMNEESYAKTVSEGRVTFFSRSKNRLWTKGETSHNYLFVKEIITDCDQDTLLIRVIPAGPTCHTGSETCFGNRTETGGFLSTLEGIIAHRKENPSENSYTSSLFSKGINKIAQKVGEEAVELVIEAKDDSDKLFIGEAADLLFHYLILLKAKGFGLEQVIEELQSRHQK